MTARSGFFLAAFLFLLAGAYPGSAAYPTARSGPFPQLLGAAQIGGPSLYGFEFNTSVWFAPFSEHDLVVGPRGGLRYVSDSGAPRWDFLPGAEAILWIGNALGPGVGVDPVFTISGGDADTPFRMRWEAFFAIRLFHFQEDGAWAVRLGTVYDTAEKWAFRAGVSLQLAGAVKEKPGD